MSSPRILSVCIPTYNRREYLGATLDSIISQEGFDEIEVVINDNASSDGTEEVAASYLEIYSNIIFNRFEYNKGADANYLRVVELASSKYCWLFGSDDIMLPGALRRVLNCLHEGNFSGVTLNYFILSNDLKKKAAGRAVLADGAMGDRLIEGRVNIISQLGEFWGLITGQVVDRKSWIGYVQNHDISDFFNAWIHVHIMMSTVDDDSKWLYVDEPCFGWRSGNDSFVADGLLRRIKIDVEGYRKMLQHAVGLESAVARSVLRMIVRNQIAPKIMTAKINRAPGVFYMRIFPDLIKNYWSYASFWTRVVPWIVIPSSVVLLMRSFYRKTMKKIRFKSSDVLLRHRD